MWWEELDALNNVTATRNFQIDINRFFPDGSSFISYINSALATAGHNLVFSYSTSTAKLTLTNNTVSRIRLIGSYRYSDRLDTAFNNVIDRLGFIQNTAGVVVAPAGTITGQGILRLLRTSCYYLTCNLLSARYRQSVVPNPYNNPNILARITAGNFGTLSQLQFAQTMTYGIGSNDILGLMFSLLDDELLPIDLAGSPITLSLRLIIN